MNEHPASAGEPAQDDVQAWLQTPPGQLVLDWEQARFAELLPDVFGYHALQLGVPMLDALQTNRMPHRWIALAGAPASDFETGEPGQTPVVLATDYRSLPFPEESLDLLVLPHALELSPDPHATLREVRRVLVHEGRVVMVGLNPLSLWAWRQWRSRCFRRLRRRPLYLPEVGEFIGPHRLRDWLRLLEFEVESTSFGVYQPALRSARGLARFRWMNRLGRRWWPIFGAVYCVVAIKRVQGARLIGQAWQKKQVAVGAPASIARREASATKRSVTCE